MSPADNLGWDKCSINAHKIPIQNVGVKLRVMSSQYGNDRLTLAEEGVGHGLTGVRLMTAPPGRNFSVLRTVAPQTQNSNFESDKEMYKLSKAVSVKGIRV